MSGEDESSQPVRPMVNIDIDMDPRSEGELSGAPGGNIMPMEPIVSGSEPDGGVDIEPQRAARQLHLKIQKTMLLHKTKNRSGLLRHRFCHQQQK